ncbi:hypothetical protein FS935_01600 [Metabacillus litoralis]|uniref:Uncharacterized protein n=1 Tax=Metabacillus litoralis TaxID=152268 RepID=A0A5C6W686_9BACI|nr:hypothetical protein [Metabacillus litoralis]TXC92914.1 hypothetical protein FS935_01600 [Metabacillus litoralis]
MNWLKFSGYQLILFIIILFLNYFADSYMGSPFTLDDLLVICISIPLVLLIASIIGNLYKNFKTRLRVKLLLSTSAFVLAVIILVSIENIWYEIFGKWLFN